MLFSSVDHLLVGVAGKAARRRLVHRDRVGTDELVPDADPHVVLEEVPAISS
jgi:hypothetical protein